MSALTATCRRLAGTLDSAQASSQTLVRAAERVASAQSHNHAIVDSGEAPLIEWSMAQAPAHERYRWWELAAGGISCLSIHALLAEAACRGLDAGEAARVDAAYFPAVCSLSALLDSLADYHGDAHTTNHSFIAHYRDSCEVAERLTAITSEAAVRVGELRRGSRHGVILAGIVAYYLSSPSVDRGFPAAAASRLIGHVGWLGAVMRTVMRVRRRLHSCAAPRPPARARSCGRPTARRLSVVLQGQPWWYPRGDVARDREDEHSRADDHTCRHQRLWQRGGKRRRKAGDEPQVAVDQRLAVEPGERAYDGAGSDHQPGLAHEHDSEL
jgi:hypothetical protein